MLGYRADVLTLRSAGRSPTAAGSEPAVRPSHSSGLSVTWDLVNGTARHVPGRDRVREATSGWNTGCFSGRRLDGGFPYEKQSTRTNRRSRRDGGRVLRFNIPACGRPHRPGHGLGLDYPRPPHQSRQSTHLEGAALSAAGWCPLPGAIHHPSVWTLEQARAGPRYPEITDRYALPAAGKCA
jgi:hypothetical protein